MSDYEQTFINELRALIGSEFSYDISASEVSRCAIVRSFDHAAISIAHKIITSQPIYFTSHYKEFPWGYRFYVDRK